VTHWDKSPGSVRVSRRKLLFAGGGLLVTGTAAAVTSVLEHVNGNGTATTVGRRPGERTVARQTGAARPLYSIDNGPKTIALTIDDGPSPVYTPQILRLLDRYGITASFSMIGRNVTAYPGVAREVAAAGHVIVNHTWNHADLGPLRPPAVRHEITRATDAIHRATGIRPRMLRAPYGAWSPTVLEYCAEEGMTPLDWSVDPQDWAMPGVGWIVGDIMRSTRTGSIILEHDGGGNRSQTVAALSIVIPRLLQAGYRFRAP
jgi:peptidoglycan-N-acetylglucosamine deacetylase